MTPRAALSIVERLAAPELARLKVDANVARKYPQYARAQQVEALKQYDAIVEALALIRESISGKQESARSR